MKQFFLISSILISFVLFSSCSDENTITQNEPSNVSLLKSSGPSANGQATLVLEFPAGVYNKQTFSFQAREKNGAVTGSFQLNWHNTGAKVHGQINCLVVNGNVATLSGAFDKPYILPPPFVQTEWTHFWFQVTDNGEGTNSSADLFSDFIFLDFELPCGQQLNTGGYGPFEIENGNVQVKP